MTWQEELAACALRAAEREPGAAEVEVIGSLAGGGVDSWSDVDLHLRLAHGATRFDPALWVAQFGSPWALTSQPAPQGRVVRVVYDDGRRLDVVVNGTAGPAPGDADEDDGGTAELMEVRQGAALAVVKLARNDLLIGIHLALGLVQRCLVQAMVLRDRQQGATSHRRGGPFNEVVERLDELRRHPWTAAGGMALVREAASTHDELAVQLDPSYVPDWSGLDALLRQAGC